MKTNKIAIIGFGPRGLHSLERLIFHLNESESKLDIQIYIFEPSKYLGAGSVWDLDQPVSNWINISDRALKDLKGRPVINLDKLTIPAFPDYSEWYNVIDESNERKSDKDGFPPRSLMGRYLHERFNSIAKPLGESKILKFYPNLIIDINFSTDDLILSLDNGKTISVDECVLTIGHQKTILNDELQSWKKHSINNSDIQFYEDAYDDALQDDDLRNNMLSVVGFGLTSIDVIRLFTTENEGQFKKKEDSDLWLEYDASNLEPKKIVPFSKDGLPCVPKPIDQNIDAQFEPDDEPKNRFVKSIKPYISGSDSTYDLNFILEPFSDLCSDIFIAVSPELKISKNKIIIAIINFLNNGKYDDDLMLSTELPIMDYMRQTCLMANGSIKPSLDYTVGQVWRQLQPTMYRLFNYSSISPELMEKLVKLDEFTKRYSYGPPLESILQLIALAESKLLDLQFLKNPDIELVQEGYKLTINGKSILCNTMINSVLSSPEYQSYNTELTINLKKKNFVRKVTDNLAFSTFKNGLTNTDVDYRLAIMGRNTKGCLLGTDAILECFSPEIDTWANGVVERLVYQTN